MNIIDKIEQFLERRANNIIGKHEYYEHNTGFVRDFTSEVIFELKQFYEGKTYDNGIWITYQNMADTICMVLGIDIDYENYFNYRVVLGRPLLISDNPMFDNKIIFYNPFEGEMGIIDDLRGFNE